MQVTLPKSGVRTAARVFVSLLRGGSTECNAERWRFKIPALDTSSPLHFGGYTLGVPLKTGGVIKARREGTLVAIGEDGFIYSEIARGTNRHDVNVSVTGDFTGDHDGAELAKRLAPDLIRCLNEQRDRKKPPEGPSDAR